MHNVQALMFFFVSYFSYYWYTWLIIILITGVTAGPAISTVEALNDVTLTCTTSTSITPDSYSWHRVDGIVPSDASGQNTRRLTIHGVVPADGGQYYCMATQFGHCAVSNNVMVVVEGISYE